MKKRLRVHSCPRLNKGFSKWSISTPRQLDEVEVEAVGRACTVSLYGGGYPTKKVVLKGNCVWCGGGQSIKEFHGS